MEQRIVNLKIKNEYIIGSGVSIGSVGSHDDVLLEMDFRSSAAWAGTTKRAIFSNALGDNRTPIILTTNLLAEGHTEVYLVPVPAEAKDVAGECFLTVEGFVTDGAKEILRIVTEEATFRVLPSKLYSNDNPSLTPSQAEQLQSEIDEIKNTIVDVTDSKEYSAEKAELAGTHALTSESWAVGQKNGKDVEKTDPTYQNNAKYWSQLSMAEEPKRQENENVRISNENVRITNEEGRVTAETARDAAEQAREEAEEQRAAAYPSVIKTVTEARDNAVNAAASAQAAKAALEQSIAANPGSTVIDPTLSIAGAAAEAAAVGQLKQDLGTFVYKMAPFSSTGGQVVKDISGTFASGTDIYVRFISVTGGTAGKGNIYGINDNGTEMLQSECVIGEDYLLTLPNNYTKIRLYMNVANREETLTGIGIFMDGSKVDISGELVRIRELIAEHIEEYTELYNTVNHVPVNLYKGEFVPNGYYDTDGTWVSNSKYQMLKLNNGTLHEGDVVTFSKGYPFYQNQYRFDVLREDGGYIKYIAGTYNGDENGKIVLSNIGYENFKLLMRIKASQDASQFMAVTGGYLMPVTNFKVLSDEFDKQIAELSPLKGKVINCLGDSFTASSVNKSWCGKLAERVGCTCNNYGVASSRISVDINKEELDGDGNPISNTVPSFLHRYNSMDANADITIIFGGINDANSIYFGDVALGSMESPLDSTTFYGALRLLIQSIKTYMPGKKIIGVIPPDFQPTTYYAALDDVRTACRTIYAYYGIPYSDLKEECQEMYEDDYNNVTFRKVNDNNNWHPSELGHIAISEVIQGTLEKYIKA